MSQGHEAPKRNVVMQTTVGAEQPVQITATTRWEYLKKYMPHWQEMLAYELYVKIFAILGVLALAIGSPLGVVSLFIALYYRARHAHKNHEVNSARKIILAN